MPGCIPAFSTEDQQVKTCLVVFVGPSLRHKKKAATNGQWVIMDISKEIWASAHKDGSFPMVSLEPNQKAVKVNGVESRFPPY